MDQELKKYLEAFNFHLQKIEKNNGSLWQAFLRGVLGGVGSVVGVALVLTAIGWILNTIGVIPAFREQAHSLQQALEEIRRIR